MDRRRGRKRRRRTEATTVILPEDLIGEILARLPAKSVLRFRAVCTSWRRLLSDPAFLRAHHRQASRAVLLCHGAFNDKELPLAHEAIHRLSFGQPAAAPIDLDIGGDRGQQHVALHGCCDGLLLLSRNFRWKTSAPISYLVCNPATRERCSLPAGDAGIPRTAKVAGFYLHAPTAEYRVLFYEKHSDRVPRPPPRQRETVARNSYRYLVAAAARDLGTTRHGGCTRWPATDAPALLRGRLHWMRCFPRIVAFDTVTEEFRGMRGPPENREVVGRLFAMDGTLGASAFSKEEGAVRVWELEDYRSGAWAFKYLVDVSFLGPRFDWLGIAHVTDDGDALFYGGRRYGVYNLKTGKVVSAGWRIRPRLVATWHVYQESLVSPGPKATPPPLPAPPSGFPLVQL